MKFNRSIFVFSIFIGSLLCAQNMRFVYVVSMKPDSTNKKDVKTEQAYLDISAEKSIFYGAMRLKRDSVMQRMRTTGNFNREQMQNLRSDIDYIIEKDASNRSITFKNRLMRDQYSYEEDRVIQ